MRIPHLQFLCAALLILPASLTPILAAPLAYEGVDYPAGLGIGTRAGGVGWSTPWNGAGLTADSGLEFAGLSTVGRRLVTGGNNSSAVRSFDLTVAPGLIEGNRYGREGTELWFSCLVRCETNFINGSFAGISLFDSAQEELFLGIPTGAKQWSFQQPDLGAAPGNTTVAPNAPILAGETTRLVLRLQFGVNGTQDQVSLYVNPPADALPANPDATRTGADLHFNRVRLQSGPAAITTPASFDEIRLGETYADVSPFLPGPSVTWRRTAPQRVNAGGHRVMPLQLGWPDGDLAGATLEVTSSDPAVLPQDRIQVDGTGASRLVTVTPATDAAGQTTVTATLTPPGGVPVSAHFDLFVVPASSGLLASESFDYAANRNLGGLQGGTGWEGHWTNGIPGGTTGILTTAPDSLTVPNASSEGGRIRLTSGASGLYRRTQSPVGEEGSVRYLSVLVRPDGVPSPTASFGLRLLGGGGTDLFVGKSGSGNPQRYVLEEAGGSGQVITTRPVVANQTALLVVKLESRPGADRISLYVDPPADSEPAIANAVKSNLDLDVLRGIGLFASAFCSFDELRVGTSYASVVSAGADFSLQAPEGGSVTEGEPVERQVQTVAPLPPGRTLTYELVGDSFGASMDPATGRFTWVPRETDGGLQRTFTVRATSNANPPGVGQVSFTLTVKEENQPPEIRPVAAQSIYDSGTLTVQLSATDADLPPQSLTFGLPPASDNPAGLAITPAGALSWTAGSEYAGTTVTLRFEVRDTAGGITPGSVQVQVRPRQSLEARWVGPDVGDWDNPANWDIGRVPNDTETEQFQILRSSRPVTLRIRGEVSVSQLALTAGETLELTEPTSLLRVRNHLSWFHGTVRGEGRLVTGRRSELFHQGDGILRLGGRATLELGGQTLLTDDLQCDGDVRIVVPEGAELKVNYLGGLPRISGAPEMRVAGSFFVTGETLPIQMIPLRIRGEATLLGTSVAMPPSASPHYIVEPGGQLTATPVDGTQPMILGGTMRVEAGARALGWFRAGPSQIAGTLWARALFDRVELGAEMVQRLEVHDRTGFLVSDAPLELRGRLELDPLPWASLTEQRVPRPSDRIVVARSRGGITGEYENAPFGHRIHLPQQAGSLVVSKSADGQEVALSHYWPEDVTLASVPLDFLLGVGDVDVPGCFMAPHPGTALPAGSWAGGRVQVRILEGYQAGIDELRFTRNSTFHEGEQLELRPLPGGDQAAVHRGVEFATVRLTPSELIADLNANGEPDAIVALLGHLKYTHPELTSDWFTDPDRRYPTHQIEIVLTTADGTVTRSVRDVLFPIIVALGIEPKVLHSAGTARLYASLSNGQYIPVPRLASTWSEERVCSTTGPAGAAVLRGSPGPDLPGVQIIGNPNEPCCHQVDVRSGSVTTSRGLQVQYVLSFSTLCDIPPWCGLAQFCPYIYLVSNWVDLVSLCHDPVAPSSRVRPHDENAGSPPFRGNPAAISTLESIMLESGNGRRLAALYRQHSADVIAAMTRDPWIIAESQVLLMEFSPGVLAFIAGQGHTERITLPMLTRLNRLWDRMIAAASPSLRAAMIEERDRFRYRQEGGEVIGFHDFLNRDFNEWAGLLGIRFDGAPRFKVYLSTRTSEGFFLLGNDLPGADPVVWRSEDMTSWEAVVGGQLQRIAGSLEFRDPNPPSGQCFYQVRW